MHLMVQWNVLTIATFRLRVYVTIQKTNTHKEHLCCAGNVFIIKVIFI